MSRTIVASCFERAGRREAVFTVSPRIVNSMRDPWPRHPRMSETRVNPDAHLPQSGSPACRSSPLKSRHLGYRDVGPSWPSSQWLMP